MGDKQSGDYPANINIDSLAKLFEPEAIRDGTSLQTLNQWDRYSGLYTALKVQPSKGISTDPSNLSGRRKRFGSNLPILRKVTTIWQFVKETFEDQMLQILCVAAAVSLVLGILTQGISQGWLQGASILLAIGLIVSVTSINNYLKQRQFMKLNKIAQRKFVNVRRNEVITLLDVQDLLVGDMVKIQTGQIMSVDGLLTQCNDISVDESAMTGQSLSIKKSIPQTWAPQQMTNPFMISGSTVLYGSGEMIVLTVGSNTQYGKIREKITMADDDTPLQQKLQLLAVDIGRIGTISAILTFAAMMLHLLWDIVVAEDKWAYLSLDTVRMIVEYFIIAVSIIVVAVPEGLPLAVTIALAYSVGKMKDENNLVRYLSACQTMGGVDNICTDKTGTLTKNSMEVLQLLCNNKVYGADTKSQLPKFFQQKFSFNCCLNSNAYPIISSDHRFQMVGSKTECALLQQAYKYGYDYRQVRCTDGMKVLRTFPFSSQRKKMGVVYSLKQQAWLSIKGAPEVVVTHCSEYYTDNGDIAKVDDLFIFKFKEAIKEFSSASLRTLLIAQKKVNPPYDSLDRLGEQGLIFIGLVGIRDPLRPEIVSSVQKCKRAGITVRMVTGDNEQTAISIAKQAGILDKNWKRGTPGQQYAVMQGKQFRTFVEGIALTDDQRQVVKNINNFKIVEKQLRVLARSSPQDKYLITTGLKQLNHVVAVTGDGTNDAPALKKADIGFAMGLAGTEVAKDAAGIILLDDNFASIVTATKWGRNILQCIRKFLQFQLTVNVVALFLAFIGSVFLKESPLNPIQMLWVNLIMDTFASLALATEPPSEQILLRKPYSRFESLITPFMWKNILFQAVFQICVLTVILFFGPQLLGVESSVGRKNADWNQLTGKHYAVFFNIFVLMQLFNQINARKLKPQQKNIFKGFFNNQLFLGIIFLQFAVQILLIQLGGKSLRVTSLSCCQHIFCIGVASLTLISGFASKLIGPAGINVNLFAAKDKQQ